MTKGHPPSKAVRTRIACSADVDALVSLINAAFVVERPIFDGDRTNSEGVRACLGQGTFLVAEDLNGLAGCVYVELRGDRGYIGLLSVAPARQGSGLGRLLMQAAEDFCREKKCVAVDLRVVSARTPLPDFYRRLGYMETHTSELPAGAHPRIPCHFIHMSKRLEPIPIS